MNPGTLTCLSITLLSVAAFATKIEKIVGGVSVKISDFPYQTSVRHKGRHFCGGSIISRKHVLTAAHCVQDHLRDPDKISVYTGSSKSTGTTGNKHLLERIHVYPGYLGTESSSYRHDIAVLTLIDEIAFDANQTKIKIASKNVRLGDNATITGWGITKFPSKQPSTDLLKANMKILPAKDCVNRMPIEIRNKLKLYKEQVCALDKKGVGVCSGDSGSPLVVDHEVMGIASFVIPCGEGFPDVYTNVWPYVKWIKSIVDN